MNAEAVRRKSQIDMRPRLTKHAKPLSRGRLATASFVLAIHRIHGLCLVGH